MDAHERIYRALLIVYPTQHRRDYGEPMVQLLRDRLRDEGGGAGTALVWAQTLADLVRTGAAERMEMTMRMLTQGWWRVAAGGIAVAMVALGFGNLAGDDPGPLYGKVLAAAVAVALAGTVAWGLVLGRRNRARGSLLVGLGVVPGTVLLIMFWWPPVAAIGLLSLVVALRAFADAARHGPAPAHARSPA